MNTTRRFKFIRWQNLAIISLIVVSFTIFSVTAFSAISTDPSCTPENLSLDGSNYGRVRCEVKTDDVGTLYVVVVSTEARIRANPNGTINSNDWNGIRSVLRAKSRVIVTQRRNTLNQLRSENSERRRKSIIFNAVDVE